MTAQVLELVTADDAPAPAVVRAVPTPAPGAGPIPRLVGALLALGSVVGLAVATAVAAPYVVMHAAGTAEAVLVRYGAFWVAAAGIVLIGLGLVWRSAPRKRTARRALTPPATAPAPVPTTRPQLTLVASRDRA